VTAFLFLIFCAMATHWILVDVIHFGPHILGKTLTLMTVGQSLGGILLLAIFQTGDKRLAGR
jgi:hypothetical protein